MERIPILKMGEFLLVTIQVDMHDRLALTLQDDLTSQIVKHQAKGVLIDISTLEMVDSFIGRMLGSIAAMARLLDAETVVVGMQPSVAITLVELGLSMQGIRTALDVEKGMAALKVAVLDTGKTRMTVSNSESMELRSSEDIVVVRQAVRKKAVALGFGLVDQTKVVTASSELARNMLDYGGGGTVQLEVVRKRPAVGPPADLRRSGTWHPGHRTGPERRLHLRPGHGLGAGRRKAAFA